MNGHEKNFTFGSYTVEELAQGVYAIDSKRHESMYLVCGTQRAVMIDTGSSSEPLMPLIRELWDGPVELVLTHAHYDHMENALEFDKVSLHEAEKAQWWHQIWSLRLGETMAHIRWKHFPMRSYSALHTGEVIYLGGRALEIQLAAGHTRGSIMLIDRADKLIFTGDALGSGRLVWMWMRECMNIGAYRESLREIIRLLEPIEDYRMYGGHRHQGKPFSHSEHAYELSLQVVRDLETLCGMMLNGEAQPVGKKVLLKHVHTAAYRYGQAGIVTAKWKIK